MFAIICKVYTTHTTTVGLRIAMVAYTSFNLLGQSDIHDYSGSV